MYTHHGHTPWTHTPYSLGITVTLKSSWSSVPYTKKLNLILDGDSIKPGTIESLSDPRPEKARIEITYVLL